MKYKVVGIFVLLILNAACSRNDMEPFDNQGIKVEFATNQALWNKTVRSEDEESNSTPIYEDAMLVYGYFTDTDQWIKPTGNKHPYFMDGVVVTNTPDGQGNNQWSYDKERFFHFNGWHSFLAIRNYNALAADSRNVIELDENKLPVVQYYLHENELRHIDLQMGWGNYQTTNGSGSSDKATITLEHATTKLTFSGARGQDCHLPEGSTIKIQSIALTNLNNRGKASFAFNNNNKPDRIAWHIDKSYNDISLTASKSTLKIIPLPYDKSTVNLMPDGLALYVLPQSEYSRVEGNDPKSELIIRITAQESAQSPIMEVKKTFELTEQHLSKFKTGSHVNITILCSDKGADLIFKLVDPGDDPVGDPLN